MAAVRQNFIRRSRGITYITRRGFVVRCQVPVILLGEGVKEKAYIVGPFRYNYYCGCTKDPMLIRDHAFIKPGAPTTGRHTPGFLKLILCGSSVCMFVCVCLCVRTRGY